VVVILNFQVLAAHLGFTIGNCGKFGTIEAMPDQQYTFCQSFEEAAERYKRFKKEDPFPSIPRALLSSAEIYDYARVTGMVHPFYESSLKSASYEAHIDGQCIMWNAEEQRMQPLTVHKGDNFELPANSIALVQVEPKFYLPDYIAIRFNLRITHVHRGLLLGTGPLVDPGFQGKILIPLHNLTAEKYTINTGKALIWVEFTKTTYGFQPEEWEATPNRACLFSDFPDDKKNLEPFQYINKASEGGPIRSSIPKEITTATEKAKEADRSAAKAKRENERMTTLYSAIGFGAIIALIVSLATIYLDVKTFLQGERTYVRSFENTLDSQQREIRVWTGMDPGFLVSCETPDDELDACEVEPALG